MINDNNLICSICCARTRSPECEGCKYYSQSRAYSQKRSLSRSSEPTIWAVNSDIDEKVDQALALLEMGATKQAESKMRDLLQEHFQIPSVHFGMGAIHLSKNDYDEAVSCFDRAVEMNPFFVEAWYNKGSIHQIKLELPEMLNAFKKVVRYGDLTEEFVVNARKMLSDFEKTVQKEYGLNLDDYLKFHHVFNDAFAAMEKSEWETALSGFQQVIANNPRHHQSYGNMGLCYAHLGQKEKALEALDKALGLDPEYTPALINREAVASLAEGEKLQDQDFRTIDFHKDQFLEERPRSWFSKLFK